MQQPKAAAGDHCPVAEAVRRCFDGAAASGSVHVGAFRAAVVAGSAIKGEAVVNPLPSAVRVAGQLVDAERHAPEWPAAAGIRDAG